MNLILLFFAHWIGDFVLQTTSMALEKCRSLKWLSIHVLTYSIPILIASVLLLTIREALIYTIINAVLHWITDFITSKFIAKYKKEPRIMFPIIGLDQFVHISCLYWTMINFKSIVCFFNC